MNPVDQPKGKTLSVGAGCKHRIAVSLTHSSWVGVECKEYELSLPLNPPNNVEMQCVVGSILQWRGIFADSCQ